jgi:hypothetical protein
MKTIRFVSLMAVLFSCATMISAQTAASQAAAAPTANKPKTELETFQEKYGAVIVQGYTKIPEMRGTLGGTFTIIAKQFTDAGSGLKVKGLVMEVDTGERYSSEARSFVEYGEINSLLKGIDYIAKLDKSVTKLSSFEAAYKTKDDFEVTVFNSSNGGLRAAISVGRIGRKTIIMELTALVDLTAKLQQAKTILDGI